MKHLVYADVETTGLNESGTGAHILELGLLAVAIPTFAQVARFSAPIRPPNWETVKRNLDEKVLAMHTNSGLIAEIDKIPQPNGADVERAACEFMQQWAPKTLDWHTPMAGANPSFDRKWLLKHMPKLAGRFHYRHFECRTITFLQEWVLGEEFKESPHRALADCEQANETIRSFLGLQ